MNLSYENVKLELIKNPKIWLITGVAGFIGSNLLESLLYLNQKVVGLDNFSTGHQENLDDVKAVVGEQLWGNFDFIEGDIRNLEKCREVMKGVDHVLHQAALGSVPRSINDPLTTNSVNINGYINLLVAAKDEGVKSFTYAASSSTYGDHPALPKVEDIIGNPLSPYAVTKYVNELYANVFATTYGLKSIGLRYFNVFGKRQDPCGAYAAVIPKWISALINSEDVIINGDGETSRDFCFIDNVVQANLLAATNADNTKAEVFNVAVGERTSLNQLFLMLRSYLADRGVDSASKAIYSDFRRGDVRHSQASIHKAQQFLGYSPSFSVSDGIRKMLPWYISKLSKSDE